MAMEVNQKNPITFSNIAVTYFNTVCSVKKNTKLSAKSNLERIFAGSIFTLTAEKIFKKLPSRLCILTHLVSCSSFTQMPH